MPKERGQLARGWPKRDEQFRARFNLLSFGPGGRWHTPELRNTTGGVSEMIVYARM